MLDIKSMLVLKFLSKQCSNGTYKIIDASDVISAMPARYKIDSDGLEHILTYLERQDCISIKYDDDGVYCLCVLPYGYELTESDSKKERKHTKFPSIFFCTIVFALAFVGALLGGIIAKLF